jgi:hypothetical protein
MHDFLYIIVITKYRLLNYVKLDGYETQQGQIKTISNRVIYYIK